MDIDLKAVERARPLLILLFSPREDVRSALEMIGTVRIVAEPEEGERSPALLVADFTGDHPEDVERRIGQALRPGDAVAGLLAPDGYRPRLFLDGEAPDLDGLAGVSRELFDLVALETEAQAGAALRRRIQDLVRDPEVVGIMEEFVVERIALLQRLGAQFRKRTERLSQSRRELREARERLVQAEKMAAVGRLAAGFAHDINNPLGVILGFAQGLDKRVPEGSPLRLPVASIVREAVRCKNLVQTFLTFSRTAKESAG